MLLISVSSVLSWVLSFALMLALYLIVNQIFGGIVETTMPAAEGELPQMTVNKTAMIVWTLVGLIPAYMFFAVAAKRAHDRGKSAKWLLLFVPGWLFSIYQNIVMLGGDGDVMAMMMDPTMLTLQMIVGVISLGVMIWWLVDLGILEGREGPNAYGPDPRGVAVAA